MKARRAPLVAAAVGLALLLRSGSPRACGLASSPAHVIDPAKQGVDVVAPSLPPLPPAKIKRGTASGGDGCGSTSCDDVGIISVPAVATDDMTPPEKIGYRLTVVAGTLPQGVLLPSGAVDPFFAGAPVSLFWSDGATDDQEPFDFTLQVVAIDQAGNESAPQTLRIQDGGSGCACRTGAGRGRAPGALALAALALAAVRRQRSRCI